MGRGGAAGLHRAAGAHSGRGSDIAGAEAGAERRGLEPWRDPAAEPFIRIECVTKKFGDFTAVDEVSLDIYRGELFGLLGASGCGKTTLLRVLAGFEDASAGRIVLDGEDMTGMPPYERPVNMMFQTYALFPHMTVEQNVAFGLKQDRVPRAELKRRVGDALELVQLAPWARRKPHQLSGGQRQRVALARALVKRPKVLLLDEPLAALDKKLREQTQFELMNIQDEVGVTFVVVTHDQEEAMTLSTRIAVMDRGRIMQVGTPSEVYEFPSTRFTADFVGSVNLFEGRVRTAEGGRVRMVSDELGQLLEVAADEPLSPGQAVWLALRPEKVAIARDMGQGGAGAGRNVIRGTVSDVAYLGDMSIYRVQVAGGRLVEVTVPNLVHSTEREIDWGDPVVLSWEPGAGLLLLE